MQYTGPSKVAALAPTAPVATQALKNNVTRSLYRNLLQAARQIDNATVSKVLLPIPRKLQTAVGLTAPLYIPGSVKYADLVRRAFRVHKPGEAGNPILAFEALNLFRAHRKTVEGLLEAATKEHDGLVRVLDAANPSTEQYWAKPILAPAASKQPPESKSTDLSGSGAAKEASTSSSSSSSSPSSETAAVTSRQNTKIKDLFARKGSSRASSSSGIVSTTIEPKVGMALVAHPLSSAHVDRRVILLVESSPATTTGLVLDMFYTYPLSHGNPMFPEVFFGHEIFNGGYLHVDYSMPPIANVTVLHTLPPPSDGVGSNTSYNARWLSWALKNKVEQKSAPAHHERLCKPIIPGDPKTGTPTLYMSKVEALPYLGSLVPGQPRSSVRIYWGCMRWSTMQLATEIANGHWMPVSISPNFFGAYPVSRAAQQHHQSPQEGGGKGGKRSPASFVTDQVVDTFPTEEMLRESKSLRTKLLGVDVVPPQTFPPDQPVCRREPLWDQIMLSLGGEYHDIVGAVNPFVSTRQHSQHHQQVASTPKLAASSQASAASANAAAAAAAAAAGIGAIEPSSSAGSALLQGVDDADIEDYSSDAELRQRHPDDPQDGDADGDHDGSGAGPHDDEE